MEDSTHPPFAELKAGITAQDLHEAIKKSGYPFQAVVAETIRSSPLSDLHDLKVQEEWAFIDRESGQTRSTDILVDAAFSHGYDEPASKLRTRLNLLVECKQSDLPYVFFLRPTPQSLNNTFPEICGLESDRIRIFTEEAKEEGKPSFSWWLNLRDALELDELPFFGAPTPYAISLAKAARRGPKLELTGEDAYRSLTLPLLKAADHLRSLSEPEADHPLRFPRIVINLAVVRAPMISTFLNAGEHELLSLPWVRVSHLEPTEGTGKRNDLSGAVRHFDVVHESFLPRYLEVLARDTQEAALRMHMHSIEVSSSLGFSDMQDGHRSLTPLPEHYAKYLSEPCTIFLSRYPRALGMQVDMSSGHISDPATPNVVGWMDGYEWL